MSKQINIRNATFTVSDEFADATRHHIVEMGKEKPWTGFQDMLQRCFELQESWTLAEVQAVMVAFYPENKISLAILDGSEKATEYATDRLRTDIRRFNSGQMPGQKETGKPSRTVKVEGLPVGKQGMKKPAEDGADALSA